MLTASRSTNGRAKPTGHGQPNGDGAYGHDSNDAGPRPGGEERESLLTEQRGLGNNLRGRRVGSAWPGRLPDATLYMQRFNVCELFGRDGFRKLSVSANSLRNSLRQDKVGSAVSFVGSHFCQSLL